MPDIEQKILVYTNILTGDKKVLTSSRAKTSDTFKISSLQLHTSHAM